MHLNEEGAGVLLYILLPNLKKNINTIMKKYRSGGSIVRKEVRMKLIFKRFGMKNKDFLKDLISIGAPLQFPIRALQYRPAYFTGFEQEIIENINSMEELFNIEFIKIFTEDDTFHHYKIYSEEEKGFSPRYWWLFAVYNNPLSKEEEEQWGVARLDPLFKNETCTDCGVSFCTTDANTFLYFRS